jgi:hypothetical protein
VELLNHTKENGMIELLIKNKEWIFSGVGVAVISWLFFRGSNKNTKSMNQKSGNNSTNIQVGGDVKDSFRGDKDGN